jgi:hypothetical protein
VFAVPGLLENPDSLMHVVAHIWVGDTGDGGFSEWLPSIDGRALPRWEGHEDKSEILPRDWRGKVVDQDSTSHTLRAHCKCKGVDFLIQRPREGEEIGMSAPAFLGKRLNF